MANLMDLVGRIFISAVFLLSAYNKIFNFADTVTWMEGYGIPGFLLWPTIILEVILPVLVETALLAIQLWFSSWAQTPVDCRSRLEFFNRIV